MCFLCFCVYAFFMVDTQQTRILPDELRTTLPIPGTILRERYRLDSELGRGGMGTVWLARRSDGRFEGRAAIKLLNLPLLDAAGAERFRREATALRQIIGRAHGPETTMRFPR